MNNKGFLALFLLAAALLVAGIAAATDPVGATVSAGTNIVSFTSTPAIAFTNSTALASDTMMSGRHFVRTMQNIGTVPVLYVMGSTVATTNLHGVLAAGVSTRDGLGSLVDLSLWRGPVTVMCETGTGTVVTVEMYK